MAKVPYNDCNLLNRFFFQRLKLIIVCTHVCACHNKHVEVRAVSSTLWRQFSPVPLGGIQDSKSSCSACLDSVLPTRPLTGLCFIKFSSESQINLYRQLNSVYLGHDLVSLRTVEFCRNVQDRKCKWVERSLRFNHTAHFFAQTANRPPSFLCFRHDPLLWYRPKNNVIKQGYKLLNWLLKKSSLLSSCVGSFITPAGRVTQSHRWELTEFVFLLTSFVSHGMNLLSQRLAEIWCGSHKVTIKVNAVFFSTCSRGAFACLSPAFRGAMFLD